MEKRQQRLLGGEDWNNSKRGKDWYGVKGGKESGFHCGKGKNGGCICVFY